MKKLTYLLLCLCLVFSGCGKVPAVEASPETQPTQIQTQPTQAPAAEDTEPAAIETIPAMAYQNPFTAVSLIPYSAQTQADDGTLLYRCSSQTMALLMNDHAVANVINTDFASRNDKLLAAAKAAMEDACAEYSGEGEWEAYFCDVVYCAERIDQMLLSISGCETFFDGTHRSGQTTFSLNYDMQTGAFLTLQDVLVPDFSADALVPCILDALADRTEDLFPEYADSVAALFSTNAPVENWYFSENGLYFYFNPYEIAPQSQGTVLALIPYSQLTGILQDGFFPAEAVEFTGDIIMSNFDAVDTNAFSQFAEAVLDSTGTQHLIYTQGTVLNVKVEMGTWTKSGAFIADAVIFTAEALTEGNALMLQLRDEDLGGLCITYQTGQQIIRTPWQNN